MAIKALTYSPNDKDQLLSTCYGVSVSLSTFNFLTLSKKMILIFL